MAVTAAPAPYGEDFVRQGASWAEGGVHWQQIAESSPGPTDVGPYTDQIQKLERQGGAYADGLAEPLSSLGRYYRQQGDFDQAVSLYQRAMHVVRINDGLYSDRQVPLLRELLVSYREAGDFAALDERYDYFFHLFGKGQAPYTQLRVSAALEYMRWQREAFRRGLGGDTRRLLALIDLNEELLTAIQAQVDIPYGWRRDIALSQVKNFYILTQRYEIPREEKQLLTSRDYMSMQPGAESLEEQKLQSRLRTASSRGADALQQLSIAARLEGPVEHAAVTLALGDWYFWSGNRQRSSQAYGEVVELLTGTGELALLEDWLGEPVELPDNGAFWQPELFPQVDDTLVDARYRVSSRGRVSELETTIVKGEEDTSLRRFRRDLAETLFRPRWASGQAEAVERLTRQYRLNR